MMQKLERTSLWMVAVLFVGLCPALLNAAPQMGDEKAGSKHTVTGCVQKGEESGGFTITDKDGKIWELHGKQVKLAGHVGHTVTVTGTASNQSKEDEAKIEANEKKEYGSMEHADLQVSGLKMVSESCK